MSGVYTDGVFGHEKKEDRAHPNTMALTPQLVGRLCFDKADRDFPKYPNFPAFSTNLMTRTRDAKFGSL